MNSLQKLFAYNEWAWQQVLNSAAKLDAAEYKKEGPFFWGSIHGTLVHSLFAEFAWHARLTGVNPTSIFQPADFPDVAAVRARWAEVNAALRAYVDSLEESDLARPITYRNTRGEEFALAAGDILRHVANHATEHRSQLTPTLYNLGAPTMPLDYIRFCLTVAA